MQAIKRSMAPIHFDGHILDGTAPAKHNKIFTPGQLVTGIVRISTNDLPDVHEAWVEAVGEQMTQYGDTVFNPDLRAYQRMEKAFFRQSQQLAIGQPKEILGEFAYFDFAAHIPDHDLYVPAGTSEHVADGGQKPLPPSMLVQPKLSVKPVAYNRYYIKIRVQTLGKLGGAFTSILPFLLLPLDSSSSADPSVQWDPKSDTAPPLPASWNKYRPKEVLSIGKEEKSGSSSFLKGLLKRKDVGDSQARTEVKVILAVPDLSSWSRNRPIPFHLTLVGTSSSPNDLDLRNLAINFQLFQRIRVVANGFLEDHHAIRHSSEDEAVTRGGDGKHIKDDFAVMIAGDWSVPATSSSTGYEAKRIVTGDFRISMLPSFVNGGLSIRYGLKLELIALSVANATRHVFSLLQPIISSGIRDGLPAYDDGGALVPPAYFDAETVNEEKSK